MIGMNTVEQALAPLVKVQANLEKVVMKRRQSASDRRDAANKFVTQAEQDESQVVQAAAILNKLNKLLSPTEE